MRVEDIDMELVTPMPRETDWEQRRYELAKAAMVGLIANGCTRTLLSERIASMSVMLADALIDKLKNI